jgi:hypothetical protein
MLRSGWPIDLFFEQLVIFKRPALQRRLIIIVVSDKGKRTDGSRKYPPVWEKIVPIILWILGGIVVLLVLVIFAVVLGLLPGVA